MPPAVHMCEGEKRVMRKEGKGDWNQLTSTPLAHVTDLTSGLEEDGTHVLLMER